MVCVDPSNSLSATLFINAHHGFVIASPPPLYYPIKPSMPFHNFGFSQLSCCFGWISPLTVLAPPPQLIAVAEQNNQQQEQILTNNRF